MAAAILQGPSECWDSSTRTSVLKNSMRRYQGSRGCRRPLWPGLTLRSTLQCHYIFACRLDQTPVGSDIPPTSEERTKHTFSIPPGQCLSKSPAIGRETLTRREMREHVLCVPLRRHRLSQVLAIECVKVELRTESLDAPFELRKGTNMHFYVWTREGLKSHSKNRVRLTALRVGQEKDFPGVCAGVVVCGVHGGTSVDRSLRYKGYPAVRRGVGRPSMVGLRVRGFSGYRSIRTAGRIPSRKAGVSPEEDKQKCQANHHTRIRCPVRQLALTARGITHIHDGCV